MRLSAVQVGPVLGAGMHCRWPPSLTKSATLMIIEPFCSVCVLHSCVFSGHEISDAAA